MKSLLISFIALASAAAEPSCPKGHHWTPWYDRDNPGGTGDWETLVHLRMENPGSICEMPKSVESRLVHNQQPWNPALEIAQMSPLTGFICKNADQKDKYCQDYEVRFCCPNGPSCPNGHHWTSWYDRDNPSGTGDWETLSHLRMENPGFICKKPNAIEVRLVHNQQPWNSALEVDQMSPLTGFICKNADQNDKYCQDYEVRFCCPGEPRCPKGHHWTLWYDRDNPSGTGDWETLVNLRTENPGFICKKPKAIQARLVHNQQPWNTALENAQINPLIGFICKNADQDDEYCQDYEARFCCPGDPPCPKGYYWTKYYDRDNPSVTGDYETLADLRKERPYDNICAKPYNVQARLVSSKAPWQTAGENKIQIDKDIGFVCRIKDQPDRRCHDYEARFCCRTLA